MDNNELQALLTTINSTRDWFARFEEHSPIEFGGEAELDEQLRQAQIILEQAQIQAQA